MSSDRRFKRAVGRVLIAMSFRTPPRAAPASASGDSPSSAMSSSGFGGSGHDKTRRTMSSASAAAGFDCYRLPFESDDVIQSPTLVDGDALTVPCFSEPINWRAEQTGRTRRAEATPGGAERTTPPARPRRERRKAIYDSQCLGFADSKDDDSDSQDDSYYRVIDGRLAAADKLQQRSCEDLSVNYPGDLVSVTGIRSSSSIMTPRASTATTVGPLTSRSSRRAVPPPLVKRNTVADFANTRAYQASTASLISASEQERKLRSAFSLLKLIDKKAHNGRSKDNLAPLSEVLATLKLSEFTDAELAHYKDAHWTNVASVLETDVTSLPVSDHERQRREAVWELFTSQCVFLFDHLMVLKHCFMEPLKKVQVEGHLMFAEPQDLFGNLDELCYVTYTFCYDFITLLIKGAQAAEFGRTEILVEGLTRFCQLTRDGEVYHDYCLNYPKAVSYLEQLRKNEDFGEFEKWCGQDSRCRRLLLTDLLIAPMQYCTKVPLLLNNICRHTVDPLDKYQLTECLEKLECSLKNLEKKMISLKNFERLQELQQQIVWQTILELEPRTFVPEFLRAALNRQPCSGILANQDRQLVHEGPLTLIEVSKTVDMYVFLFNDILLLTRIKKAPRKKSSGLTISDVSSVSSGVGNAAATATAAAIGQCPTPPTDGAVFVVHRQPIALDRFAVTDVRPREAAVNSLKNAFVVIHISRFNQILGVYTLQAANEAMKTTWLNSLQSAQEKYREQKHTVNNPKSSNTLTIACDDNISISSASSSVSGARLMTSYYDAWPPVHATPAQQTPSTASPTPPPTCGQSTPSSPAVGSASAMMAAVAPVTSGIADGRQLSPQSPGTSSRDQLASSSRSSSPRSPLSAAPEVIVSISDCSVAPDTTSQTYGSRLVNGGPEVGLSGSTTTILKNRVRSVSSDRGTFDSLSKSAPVAIVRGNSYPSRQRNSSYLTAPVVVPGDATGLDVPTSFTAGVEATAGGNCSSSAQLGVGLGYAVGGATAALTRSRTASLYSRRRTMLKAIREKSLSIDIDLISATPTNNAAVHLN